MHTCIKRQELQSYVTFLTVLLPITSKLYGAGLLSTPISPSQPFQKNKTTKVIHLLKIVKEFNVNTTDAIPIFKMPSEHGINDNTSLSPGESAMYVHCPSYENVLRFHEFRAPSAALKQKNYKNCPNMQSILTKF